MEASGWAYTEALSELYPTRADVGGVFGHAGAAEIAELEGRLTLPRSTELFASDIHGEYNAFSHVLRGGSGAVRALIEEVFGSTLNDDEKAALLALACYPAEHCAYALEHVEDADAWLAEAAARLSKVARRAAGIRTIDGVRALLPDELAIVEELVTGRSTPARRPYRDALIKSLVASGEGVALLEVLGALIQHLVVDQLHLIGDVYDRGPAPQLIMDELLSYPNVDVQWGNHDILWMGAAAGNAGSIANVIRMCMRYGNLATLEDGYGINLLPLATFAMEVYGDDPCELFIPRTNASDATFDEKTTQLIARMHKAITIIQFKLEGEIIRRRPEFGMDDRLLLHHIDLRRGTIRIEGKEYELKDKNWPTLNAKDPYALSIEEEELMRRIKHSFECSEKLKKHMRCLFTHGSMYQVCNSNLLFHASVPMNPDGTLKAIRIEGTEYKGKALLDKVDQLVRTAYFDADDSPEKDFAMDYIWYLWEGKDSPLFDKSRMATFERCFIDDKSVQKEEKGAYYSLREEESVCDMLLDEFGVTGRHRHIINGHVPVRSIKGENPIKANGKLLVIDGGFSKAYHPETGIAGYTLVYHSRGFQLVQHEPFLSTDQAIKEGKDIRSTTIVVELNSHRQMVKDTDKGADLQQQIHDLEKLLYAFRNGFIKEKERYK